MRARVVGLLCGALCLAQAAPVRAQSPADRRVALLIANDAGGPGTTDLRYARDDAEKLGGVLVELGGFREADLHYLFDADADRARAALVEVEARLAQARAEGAQTTLLVYYSGHARDGALRMGRTRWPMAELRGMLSRARADVRIGIVDACQSGAITRSKGGRPGPSFLFDADDGQPSRGLVLITSSSDDEDSQESDQLGGSYFTHYLASGLRGDADESGDRRVTLAEVYGYAYHKTITQTVETRSGVQHPTYSYDLQGSGDLVLTDLTRGHSGVTFGAELSGDYLIFDRARAQVAAEIKKAPGQPRRIALAPGAYVLKKRLADHLRVQEFAFGEGREHAVDERQMAAVAFEDDDTKGGGRPIGFAVEARTSYQSHLSARASDELFPPVLLWGLGARLVRVAGAHLGLDVTFGGVDRVDLQLDRLLLPHDYFQLQVGAEMLWSWAPIAPLPELALLLGPRVAAIYASRSFPDDPGIPLQDHFTISPAAVGGLGYAVGDLRIEGVARLGFLAYSVDENRSLLYLEGGLVLSMEVP